MATVPYMSKVPVSAAVAMVEAKRVTSAKIFKIWSFSSDSLFPFLGLVPGIGDSDFGDRSRSTNAIGYLNGCFYEVNEKSTSSFF